MFQSNVKYVEIPEVDEEKRRRSTIDQIEKLTLQIIQQINSQTFPKVTYSIGNVREQGFSCPEGSSSCANEAGVMDHSAMDKYTQESFDSSKSLSWVQSDNENPKDHGVNGDRNSFDSSKSLSWISVTDDEKNRDSDNEENRPGTKTTQSGTGRSMTVDFRRRASRKNLALILTVTSHVHKLLINRTSKTRRALYYELQTEPFTATLAKTQRTIDAAVNHVASLLNRAPWELAFTATSKGLVSGDLTLTFYGRESVTCNAEGGVLIPQNIHRITSIRTCAKYVLVVEKDSVFQKLLAERCPQSLNCILITGKGYPDINTRMLVSLLGNRLNIPVYVLVDADPFGIEIMCIYRFGSMVRSREHRDMVCSGARWIGIHPSEFSALGMSPIALTPADISRLRSLEGRSYCDEKLLEELKILKKGKVEIEALASLSYRFLTTVYLPRKINAKEYL